MPSVDSAMVQLDTLTHMPMKSTKTSEKIERSKKDSEVAALTNNYIFLFVIQI
jgi:hypothetical protein